MSHIICHHKGRYNIYSTVSDSFWFTNSVSLGEIKEVIKAEYGRQGVFNLPERLERAHKFGTSALGDKSLEETICCNRAGENESHLTTQQCIEIFLSERGEIS